MKARIYVTLKRDVLDPQGKAVFHSLQDLGYEEVSDVRIGRYLEVELEGSSDAARQRLDEMCRRLLANPVTEEFRVEIS